MLQSSHRYISEDGEDGGDLTAWWAPGGVTWCTGPQPLPHKYTSEDGGDGGDVTGGLQVKESGVLGSSRPSNRYTSEDGEDEG